MRGRSRPQRIARKLAGERRGPDHQRVGRALFTALALCLGACVRTPARPVDWVAEVATSSGHVNVAAQRQHPLVAATVGALIRSGGRIETAEASRATLALRSGGRLRVAPLSVVEFSPRSSTGDQVTLELAQGQLEGTAAAVEAATLVIRVGGRQITLGQAAQATLSAASTSTPARLEVVFGEARVEGADGERTQVVAGGTLELTLATARPAAPTPTPTAASATATADGATPADGGLGDDARGPIAEPPAEDAGRTDGFFVRRVGRGAVELRLGEQGAFAALRGTQPRPVAFGSALRLGTQARALVGRRDGPQTQLTGPGLFVLRRDRRGAGPGLRLEARTGRWTLSGSAQAPKNPLPTVVEGVTVTPRAGFRDSSIAVHQREHDAELEVLRGEAGLIAQQGEPRTLEAGESVLLSAGKIGPSRRATASALRITEPGPTRVFVAGRTLPVTFDWRSAPAERTVVEVSRSSAFQRPLFADALRRRELTLQLDRGARETVYFWRLRPVNSTGRLGAATAGRLTLVPDTSHRALENLRPPRNLIREDYGNTTVYYQNSLPRFVFTWDAIAGATSYAVKVVSESDVGTVLVNETTSSTSLTLPAGHLGEGTYIWYVVGRAGETLVRTSEQRRLRVAYDNATPDLQIVYPRNGTVVTTAELEVRGAIRPGTAIQINGQALQLDHSARFLHRLALVPGRNDIVFRVSDKRRGSSLYVRTVLRR
ncbi:MAG: FecR domain-containing protein [Proteobacteria bacterium]|nr:FecR domain-containing protein [Pseudomonadota bacterium]